MIAASVLQHEPDKRLGKLWLQRQCQRLRLQGVQLLQGLRACALYAGVRASNIIVNMTNA